MVADGYYRTGEGSIYPEVGESSCGGQVVGRSRVNGYELLADILDGVPQAVWVVDNPGDIVFTNPAALALLGYDEPTEVIGRPAHETIHYKRPDGSPYPLADCPMLTVRSSGETRHGEDEWFVRRDASMVPVAWWSAPLEMRNGRGAVLAFTDITDRLRDERAARERDAANIREVEARAAQRRGIENERAIRRHVSVDLRGGARHRLETVLVALQAAQETIDPASPAAPLVARAREQARDAIEELQKLAAGVYPAILTSGGLTPAVAELGDRAPFPVSVTDTTTRRFPESVESHGYFFVAEALTNVAKHAHATSAAVTIEQAEDVVVISVRDNGVGGVEASTRGSGLLGLADRLAAVNGAMSVTSPRGSGTILRASIPFDGLDHSAPM
jgi:PAS domain S-box-containing protein